MGHRDPGNAIGVKVGDRVMKQPLTFGSDQAIAQDKGIIHSRKAYPGTVTYVHPSGRWYNVTFDNGLKESFFI